MGRHSGWRIASDRATRTPSAVVYDAYCNLMPSESTPSNGLNSWRRMDGFKLATSWPQAPFASIEKQYSRSHIIPCAAIALQALNSVPCFTGATCSRALLIEREGCRNVPSRATSTSVFAPGV